VPLGRIGDPRAARTVLRMLFEERPGVSSFEAASFAVSQIGAPMAPPLLAVLEGRDAELARWASTRGVVPRRGLLGREARGREPGGA
jgi:hypothetical protein